MLNWGFIIPGLIEIIGLVGFVVSLLVLIIQAIRKKKLKKIVISLLVCILLIVLGIFLAYQTGVVKTTNAADPNAESFSGVKITAGAPLSFQTTDINGNPVDSSVFSQYKVTMINRWEPWCEPCKAEMPDFQALYEKYGDRGFNIIGVYQDEGGLQEALDNAGVTYPIVKAADDLDFDTMSFPTTIFVDSEGRILNVPKNMRNPLAGSLSKYAIGGGHSYDEWEKLVLGYLG